MAYSDEMQKFILFDYSFHGVGFVQTKLSSHLSLVGPCCASEGTERAASFRGSLGFVRAEGIVVSQGSSSYNSCRYWIN
jgi:hypothetical protein